MKKTIAIAGKGGSGKTTLSCLLARYIIDNFKASILAIDADPNDSLATYLGIDDEVETIMDIVAEVLDKPESIPASMTKERFINLRLQEAVVEKDAFDFLSMGRPEGPGCYCYANNLLKGLIEKIKNSYAYTIIDNEAGLEHLSRRITPTIDILFIVCGLDITSFKTAGRILEITKKLKFNIGKKILITNRIINGLRSGIKDLISAKDIEYGGSIDEDKELIKLSSEGKSIFELPKTSVSFKQSKVIFEKIKEIS